MKLYALTLLILLTTVAYAFGMNSANVGPGGLPMGKNGIISGQVMLKGKIPMAEGIIFLFDDSLGPPPSREKYWRVPDIIEDIGKDGKFSIVVPEGKYYLIATKKDADQEIGPPRDGELFYLDADAKGNPKPYIVTSGIRTDIGIISGVLPFFRNMVIFDRDITAVEGIVADMEGAPVKGALVFAFVMPNKEGRPLFVSEWTGKDGKFVLRTHDGGSYNLRVRSTYGGGPPEPGEFVGSHGPSESIPVTLKKGEKLKGITLKVKKFPKRGPGNAKP